MRCTRVRNSIFARMLTQLCHRITRKRRDFGVGVEMIDQEMPEKMVDLRKQIVTNYDLRRVELDVGLQVRLLRVLIEERGVI